MAASVKPSVEEVPSGDRQKIHVTLSCRDSSIPERRLVLTRSLPAVRVGRSSKVSTKGFVPALDNAWFDNPVMSRQHAEILAEFDEKGCAGVYLKDVASFHGTFYTPNDGLNKERRIASNETVKLANGDIIKFGSEILRTNKTYPPCYVDFLMEEATTKTDKPSHRAFTVPDDIDEEEDGNCENEDGLDVMAPTDKSTPATFKGLKPWLAADQSRPSPIDLTVDGDNLQAHIIESPTSVTSNRNFDSDVIDLTSEPTHKPAYEEPEVPKDYGFGPPRARRGSVWTVIHSGRVKDGSSAGPFLDFAPEQDTLSDDWDDDEDEDEDEANDDSESDSVLHPEYTDETSELGDTDGLSLDLDESSDPESEHEASDHSDEEPVSDVDAEMSFNGSDESCVSGDEHDGKVDFITTETPNNGTRVAPYLMLLHGAPHNATTSSGTAVMPPLESAPPVRSSPPRASFHIHNPFNNRDPSPSDAALFKCNPFFDNVPNDNRAHELGVKTGKFEFFAAREENRVAVNQHHQTIPTSAIRETLPGAQLNNGDDDGGDDRVTVISDASSPFVRPESDATAIVSWAEEKPPRGDSEAPDTSSIKLGDADVNQSSAWISSGDQFINNPTQEPQPAQPLSADFDMTSAYKFQQSKLAIAAQTITKNRCLHIQDLLAHEPKECLSVSQSAAELPPSAVVPDSPISRAHTPTKRSYDEAFNQPDNNAMDEYANDNVAVCPVNDPKKSDQNESPADNLGIPAMREVPIVQAANDVGRQDIPAQNSAFSDRSEVVRPAKKIRVAQAIACLALGGAATFSYLVNTAPVF
ncbi:hypothetical protein F4861DRAFT_321419 [Xylaria intraflava]|nr:hypothetical protein F4861DRAFT_321419 [Xylaria intraflava]